MEHFLDLDFDNITGKRDRESEDDNGDHGEVAKKIRTQEPEHALALVEYNPNKHSQQQQHQPQQQQQQHHHNHQQHQIQQVQYQQQQGLTMLSSVDVNNGTGNTGTNLPSGMQPYPFFYYKDYSTLQDPDPLTPLTPPGRVPNFVAKMHAILSRSDLSDVINWMPHGRSWRVLKPREFEIRVIPKYFEHAKFSSFIRQANGWGFRRVTTGRDRNSYYHPLFLRGLPHLCKQMKRPGVSEKIPVDPEHEPDLYKISELLPVPEKAEDQSVMLKCTIQGGPSARVPVESILTPYTIGAPFMVQTPQDQEAMKSFQNSLGMKDNGNMQNQNVNSAAPQGQVIHVQQQQQQTFQPQQAFMMPQMANGMNPLAAANQMAFAFDPTSQFAAGFAAAAAFTQQQFFMAAQQQQFNNNNSSGDQKQQPK